MNGLAKIKVAKPTASVINVLSTSTTDVQIASIRLRQALQATFPANSAKPTSYPKTSTPRRDRVQENAQRQDGLVEHA